METKKDILQRMSEKFISLEIAELKSYAIMNMISYEAGKAVGEEKERMKQEMNKNKKEKTIQIQNKYKKICRDRCPCRI